MAESKPEIEVALFGTGRSGTEVVRAIPHHTGLRLVAGVATNPEKQGADLGEVTVGRPNGIEVTCDLDAVLSRTPDVLIHTGLGSGPDVAAVLGHCAERGVDAITVNGLVEPVNALGERGAAELHRRAVRGGGRVLGTGVNPGFLLDGLPAFWGTMVNRIDRVWARRVSEIRNWGDGALDEEIGVGLDPDRVEITRALSVEGSAAMLARSLDLGLDRMEEVKERVPAPADRTVDGRQVRAGQTVGFRHRTIGYRGAEPVIEVEWLGILGLDPAIDGAEESASLRIEGDAEVAATCSGTLFGDPYPSTAARALNAIRPLASLPPGLYRPDQVPQSERPAHG